MERRRPALRLLVPRMFVSQDTPHGCSLEAASSRSCDVAWMSGSGICEVTELFRQ